MLATHGYGSRRQIDALIEAGRIEVQGKVAVLGQRVDGTERIAIDGKIVTLTARSKRPRVIIYHKSAGEIVSRSDPDHRASVFDQLPIMKFGRWIAVGRLDYNTSGLLLFTDSGDLAGDLMHPRTGIDRHYAVRVMGDNEGTALERLRRGMNLEDGPARFESVESGGGEGANRWFLCVLREGRNREVRRMVESVGLTVSRLIRTAFGPIELPRDLPRGAWRDLTDEEIDELLELAAAQPARRGAAI